ncbi:MAG: beta-galactosidase GalB [Mangrovibacterium sp.]
MTYIIGLVVGFLFQSCQQEAVINDRMNFDKDWQFALLDDSLAFQMNYADSTWRTLNLPHDWSIEGEFSSENPSTPEGGALPTGKAWYRKTFQIENSDSPKKYYIDFDGVMSNSEVWINEHYLGKRPFGYISFRYDLTPFLKIGDEENVIAVKVDNSDQPSSRWYTGSGIYRHVWLVEENPIHIAHWGTYVTTPSISSELAKVNVEIKIDNTSDVDTDVSLKSTIKDAQGIPLKGVPVMENKFKAGKAQTTITNQEFDVKNFEMWSPESPKLYRVITDLYVDNKKVDTYETPLAFRTFEWQAEKGFFLNGEPYKIYGVNQHHDLGALGAAFNYRAAERQLEILKEMGVNTIRMSHNPPAVEVLELCDKMGFLVVAEAFDEWAKTKAKKGYHLYWDQWHEKDLADMMLRDRNNPCIFMWSIGNEIREQFDETGRAITHELDSIVKIYDTTRPSTTSLTETDPEKNNLFQSKSLDVLSFNYKHYDYDKFLTNFPDYAMVASEVCASMATRGHYDFPSDSDRVWPSAHNAPFDGNDDLSCSAYDNCYPYWGASHRATWKAVKENDFVAGMIIWSGFDYLGEPLPYPYPARSSYFGVIDLCGFPKDAYYLYQSEWSKETMLHLYPHWNWEEGQLIDLTVYYNHADEVELFVNGVSQGKKTKSDDTFNCMWRVPFHAGNIKAVSYKDGAVVLEKEIKTAGAPAKVELIADRTQIKPDGEDLSFITVKVTDADGNLVPNAHNLIHFDVQGVGFIAGVDNGYQASTEPFKANYRKAFNGMCLLIVQNDGWAGEIKINATSEGLEAANLNLTVTK